MTAGARQDRSAVCTVTLSWPASTCTTGAPKQSRAPCASAARRIAAIARSGSITPPSGWNMTGSGPNDMPGHRSAAAPGGISSAGTPSAVRTSYIFSCTRAGP